MTINASTACGGAAVQLTAPDPANPGAVASADANAFSETLSGMAAEAPEVATEAQLPVNLEDAEDPGILDTAALSTDAAAQACVAALISSIAAPVLAPQPKQTTLPAGSSLSATVAGTARLAEVMAPGNESLAAAWLVDATTGAASAEGADAPPQDALFDAETVDRLLSLGSQPAGGPTSGNSSAASGSSPMMQVSQLGSAFAQTTTNAMQPQPPLQHSVGTARWAEELGSRIALMTTQGRLTGSLTLSPEHLGPLHVQIDIKNDVANVWFGSHHADTRAALNDALPRLREMFGTAGLVLGDTGVSRDTPRQEAHAAEARRFASHREDAVSGSMERRAVQIAHAGILDTYA